MNDQHAHINKKRADRGTRLHEKYEALTYPDDYFGSTEAMITDMLTDLKHAFPAVDIVKVAMCAKRHYDAEKIDSDVERKAKFGEKVLSILQKESWAEDAGNAIYDSALKHDLAFIDSNGSFRKKGS